MNYGTAASIRGTSGIVVTFANAVDSDGRVFYTGIGDGHVAVTDYVNGGVDTLGYKHGYYQANGEGAAIYDTQGFPINVSFNGIAISGFNPQVTASGVGKPSAAEGDVTTVSLMSSDSTISKPAQVYGAADNGVWGQGTSLSAAPNPDFQILKNEVAASAESADTTGGRKWVYGGPRRGYYTVSTLLTQSDNGSAVACFRAGTYIATQLESVLVESLRPGDLVRTESGSLRPIRRIGHRHIDIRGHMFPSLARPILIAAGSFGDGKPFADLYLSPEHALCANGGLIPARYLLNASTIRVTQLATVDSFHVELETHDVVLANGLPAETWLDNGNSSMFDTLYASEGSVRALSRSRSIQPCRPLIQGSERLARLLKQLNSLAWAPGTKFEEDASR